MKTTAYWTSFSLTFWFSLGEAIRFGRHNGVRGQPLVVKLSVLFVVGVVDEGAPTPCRCSQRTKNAHGETPCASDDTCD